MSESVPLGPTIPVRLNRSVKLQQLLAARRGHLSIVTKPRKAESSSHVIGLNKAATRGLQRHLLGWFREQSIVLDKMNRHQNTHYDNLVRLERQRELLGLHLKKAKDLKRIEAQQAESQEQDKLLPSKSNIAEKRASSVIKDSCTGKGMIGSNAHKIANVLVGNNNHKVSTSAEYTTTTAETNSKAITYRKESAPTKKAEQNMPLTLSNHVGNELSKAGTLLDKNISGDDVKHIRRESAIPSSGTEPSFTKKQLPEIVKLFRQVPHTAPSDTKNNLSGLSRSRTLPSITLQSKKQSILEEPFNCYQKDKLERIIPADIPYRRRQFLNPASKDPKVHEMMLKTEEMSQSSNRNKFSGLLKDLKKLEEWNPLADMSQYHSRGAKEQTLCEDHYQGISVAMRNMMKAFGGNYDNLLEGLDPNSKEALLICRYLRNPEDK